MYFDEYLLLDIRLNTLNEHVKKFVIAEATYAHNGKPKKLRFDINKFKKFRDKITYIVVDKEPDNIIKLSNNDTKGERGEKGEKGENFMKQMKTISTMQKNRN